MAATYTAEHVFANREIRMRENDPDTGSDAYVDLAEPAAGAAGSPTAPFIPIANFRKFVASYMTTVGTGGITAFKIMAATDAAGSGAVAVATHALGSNPDAVGDTVNLECNVEQIRSELATATHVGVLINLVTSTDEGCLTFIRAEPQFPVSGISPDYIS